MQPGRKGGVFNVEHRAVTQAKEYVHQHLAESLSPGRVAAHVGLNRSYFFRRFKRTMGITFGAYLRQARMEQAKQMLKNREMRVKEVAHESGFQSVSHFNRLFVAQEGCTPLQYQVIPRQ